MGKIIMEIEIINEMISSISEIIGLINPPVNTEDNPLKPTVVTWNPPVTKTPLIRDNIHFNPGSTSLREAAAKVVPAIIAVGVALDTMQQIEGQLVSRHYDGFLKTGRIKGRSKNRY